MEWWKMPGSWGREIGGMVQGIGTAGRSFWRKPWLKRGCCANDDYYDENSVGTISFSRASIRRTQRKASIICAIWRRVATDVLTARTRGWILFWILCEGMFCGVYGNLESRFHPNYAGGHARNETICRNEKLYYCLLFPSHTQAEGVKGGEYTTHWILYTAI